MKICRGGPISKFVGFIIIFTAYLMLILPVVSLSLIDYGHMVSAEWEIKQDGSKTAKITIDDFVLIPITLDDMQTKIGLPFRFNVVQLLIGAGLLALLFGVFMRFFFNYEGDKKDKDTVFNVLVLAMIVNIIILAVAPLIGSDHFHVIDTIRAVITDPELAEAAVNKFKKEMIFERFIGLVAPMIIGTYLLSVVTRLLVAVIHWVLDLIAAGTRKLYDRWQKRMFRKLFLESDDSVFSGFRLTDQADENPVPYSTSNGSHPGKITIQILGDGHVEVVKYRYTVEWKPFPIFVPRKTVLGTVTLDYLISLMMANSKEAAFQEIRDKLIEQWKGECFRSEVTSVVEGFSNTLIGGIKEHYHESAGQFGKRKRESRRDQAIRILQGVVDRSLRQFKREMAKLGKGELSYMLSRCNGLLTNGTKDILARFRSEIERRYDNLHNGYIIYPPGTRLFSQKGRRCVFVTEQAPRMRTVRMSDDYTENGSEDIFTLAFPHVVFVVTFQDGNWNNLQVFYRDKPLTSLNDVVYRVNLPNTHDTGHVCLGFPGTRAADYAGKVEDVINHFWHSTFTASLREGYLSYGQKEPRLASVNQWQLSSKDDPDFFRSVELLTPMRLQGIIETALTGENEEQEIAQLEQRASSDLDRTVELSLDEFQEQLMRRFAKIQVKGFDKEVVISAIDEYQERLTAELMNMLQYVFNRIIGNQKEIEAALSQHVEESFRRVLESDFDSLQQSVLIRRKVPFQEVITQTRR